MECELGKDHAESASQEQQQPGVIEQDHSSAAASQRQHRTAKIMT
jgi:hypothetical protein